MYINLSFVHLFFRTLCYYKVFAEQSICFLEWVSTQQLRRGKIHNSCALITIQNGRCCKWERDLTNLIKIHSNFLLFSKSQVYIWLRRKPGSAVFFCCCFFPPISWARAFFISFSLGFYFQLGASPGGQKWGKQTIN